MLNRNRKKNHCQKNNRVNSQKLSLEIGKGLGRECYNTLTSPYNDGTLCQGHGLHGV